MIRKTKIGIEFTGKDLENLYGIFASHEIYAENNAEDEVKYSKKCMKYMEQNKIYPK